MEVNFSQAEIVIIGALLSALVTPITILWRSHVQTDAAMAAASDKRLTEMDARLEAVMNDRDAYRDIAEQALHELEATRQQAHGRTVKPYVPRTHAPRSSPPTQINEDHAEVQTLQANLDELVGDLHKLATAPC